MLRFSGALRGFSPAEGGVSETSVFSAPTRGKAFPHKKISFPYFFIDLFLITFLFIENVLVALTEQPLYDALAFSFPCVLNGTLVR